MGGISHFCWAALTLSFPLSLSAAQQVFKKISMREMTRRAFISLGALASIPFLMGHHRPNHVKGPKQDETSCLSSGPQAGPGPQEGTGPEGC